MSCHLLQWRIFVLILLAFALVASGCGSDDPAMVSIALTPAAADLTAGSAPLSLTARATYTDGTTSDITARVAWSTSAPGQVDVGAGGLAFAPTTARVGEIGLVTVTYGRQRSSAALRVVRGPAVGVSGANDPLASAQWYLKNTGQTAYADVGGVAGEDLRLAGAHGLGLTGKGVKVAVVDTGLEILHPDLAANIVPGSWNFVDETSDPTPSADSKAGDHGTSVTGIIGMVYGNALGGMGTAPGVSLNGYNVLLNQTLVNYVKALGGSSSNPTSNDVWIFNQSFGTSSTSPTNVDPAIEALYASGVANLRSGLGAIYVRSAGNGFLNYAGGLAKCTDAVALGTSCQNANMDAPRSLFYNIVAAALAANGKKAAYSSAGSSIWVSAPGGSYGANVSTAGEGYPPYVYEAAMVTTDRTGCVNGYALTDTTLSAFNRGGLPNLLCDYTNSFNGTSSAAPSTVGSIALLLDARPDLTWRDVKHILAMTARKVDSAIPAVVATLSDGSYTAELPWTQNAVGRWFHNWYGFGAVDVDASVAYARTYTANALGAFTDSGWTASATPLGLGIPDDSTLGATSTLVVSRALTIEAVQIEVTITHPQPGDLGIELMSPSGTKSILLNIRNGFAAAPGLQMTLVSNLFYGEPSAGSWTVKIVDGRLKDVGTLDQWKIRVLGHQGDEPVKIRTPTMALPAGRPALAWGVAGQSKSSGLASPRMQALAQVPKGASFQSSGQDYRLVLGIRAIDERRSGAAVVRRAAAGATGSNLLERKGPYAIYRLPAGAVATGGATTRAVAVNTRSGQFGVITGTITARAASAAEARIAAKAAGVALEYFTESTGYAFFHVPEGGDALAAAASLRAVSALRGIQVEVREGYDEAN
jgi:subtilisin-like proprotein convertase family protein